MTNDKVTSMQQLSAVNPYKNRDYYVSPWQQFLHNLGFRNESDAWRENMETQSAEYDAQMALKQYDEEYNLPINQVSRLRAAGINPDLSGGDGINSGEAQEPGQDPSVPMQSSGDEGKLMEFANGIMSCVSMAAGMAGTIENVRGLVLDNNLKRIAGEKDMSEYALKMFPFLFPENPNDLFTEDGEFIDNAYTGFLGRAEIFAGQLSKPLRKKFLRNVNAFWHSAPGSAEAYKAWRENMLSHKSYEVDSRTNFSWDSEEMSIIADELSKVASKVEKEGLRSTAAESKYNADYYEHLDGAAAAASENAENKMNKENFDMVGTLRSSLNNIIQRLKKFSESDKKGASITGNVLLTALSMFQLYMATNGSPSVKRSSTSGVDFRGRSYSSRSSVIDF